jgi:hypothetical protein
MQTTQEIYSHMIRGEDHEAARRWDEYQRRNQTPGVLPEKGRVQ